MTNTKGLGLKRPATTAPALIGDINDNSTTLDNVIGPVVNVKGDTYGATGDGTTDDLAAIHLAIAALPATGGTVYFPPGTYRVSSTILVNKNGVTLRGAGWLSTIKRDASNATAVVTTNTTQDVTDLVICDLHIEHQPSGTDCSVISSPSNAFSLKRYRFERLKIVNNGASASGGITVLHTNQGSTDGVIRGCQFVNANCQFATPVNLVVTGNVFVSYFDAGVSVGGAGAAGFKRVVIANNVMVRDPGDAQGGGIDIGFGTDCTVTGNTIIGAYAAGIIVWDQTNAVLGTGSDITISGNTVRGCGTNGITYSSGITVAGGLRIVVEGNVCDANNGMGISIVALGAVQSRAVVVSGNVCCNNGTGTNNAYGIEVSSSLDVSITGNVCSDTQGVPTQGRGISVSGATTAGVTITSNICKANVTNDILVGVAVVASTPQRGNVTSAASALGADAGVQGISGTNTKSTNLRGTATIADAATTVNVTFPNAEPDATYFVALGGGTLTGAPAAGASSRLFVTSKTVNGFVVNTEVAPGAGTSVFVDWVLIR